MSCCYEFLFRGQLRYFHDKIILGFCSFLAAFPVFCVFSLPFLSFLESFNQIRTLRKQLRMLFGIYRFALPVFLLFSICFFSFTFTLFFPALYNNLYARTTLNVVTLVSHSQETGDKIVVL